MPNFEWFDKSLGTPSISIGNYGITLNAAVLNMFPAEVKWVKLGFDRKDQAIGIKPVEKDDASAFDITNKHANGWVRINSKDFVRYVQAYADDIDFKKTEKFLAEWDEETQTVVVFLKNRIEFRGTSRTERDTEDEQ